MKNTNARAEKFLNDMDRQIAEIDLEYAKILVKDDIGALKVAKQILEKKL